jgi:hypothetical protein
MQRPDRDRQSIERTRNVSGQDQSGQQQPMSGYSLPRITSDWTPADTSQRHLEFAKTEYTDDRGIVVVRRNTDPGTVIPMSIQEIRNLPNALKPGGSLAHLVNF